MQDVLRLRPNGAADTDFGGTLLDRHHHDVADTYRTSQQGAETYHPHQDANTLHQVIYHGEDGFGVEYHHRLFVCGRDEMGLFHHGLYIGLNIGYLHPLFHREADHVDVVAYVVGLLHGGIG